MSGKYGLAIVGGTGRLGYAISKIFLEEFRSSFPTVRVLTRDPSTARAQELAQKGAIVQVFNTERVEESLQEAFARVDIVVNALNISTPVAVKKQIADVAVRSGVKVYYLSEFGVDHTRNDFPGYDHHDWAVKRELAAHAREAAQGTSMKVIAVYAGLFPELTFAVVGFDLQRNEFRCFGSPVQRVTFTSMGDVGRVLARLSMIALEPSLAGTAPDELRVAGDTKSYEEIRDLFAQAKGLQKGEVQTESLEERKKKLQQTEGSHVVKYIRVLMGEGKVDFSNDNANALANPAEAFWRWKTAADQLRSI
ncbi:NAD-P-binding protein [Trametes gibbosa]|nr:NAD-P-binding protein [Trametes gibbosa]